MKYIPSVNIEQSEFDEQNYIITHNAKCVVGNIIDSFHSGIHSFNIIGSYGTGKSSFILALEHSLNSRTSKLIENRGQFNDYKKFKFVKIVGDYASLSNIISEKIFKGFESKNFFDNLSEYYKNAESKGEFLFIVIDEFGKILEYASKNNPERELYLFQKFAEFINDTKKNIILITTLHQNFNSYSKSLSQSQRNEWTKVKGRFKEIVFNEPVEQLLYLAAKRTEQNIFKKLNSRFKNIYKLAIESKFTNSTLSYETAECLYPMDLFAAQALTLSIQRYGQNERTLFSFLEAKGKGSLQEFEEGENKTFNLADVYDYDIYNFFSYLSEVNSDSANWTAMRVSLERVESLFDGNQVFEASKIVKTIGILNLFGSAGIKFDKDALCLYSEYALDINDSVSLIDLLDQYKIIRFAKYKSQYVLFEGTDINIEDELLKASGIVPKSKDFIDKLKANFNLPIEFANSIYYRKGTPRYFQYQISESSISAIPIDEIDGFIHLVFNDNFNALEELKNHSCSIEDAILYVYFKRVDDIINHIWQLDKLEFVQNTIDDNDKVARKEINLLILFEREQLNNCVLDSLFKYNKDVIWVYRGEEVLVESKADFNRLLSVICEEVYCDSPTYINEMVNKHKPSSAMSVARVNYLSALLEKSNEERLNFEDSKFPPEKTIYLTLLNNTGIHRKFLGSYELGEPTEPSFVPLWNACEEFFNSTMEKPKKIVELTKTLKSRPFKLKQGFIDLWLPTFLIIKKNDYSLYDSNGTYIPVINREVLDILQKAPNEFSIKAFNVDGVKLDLFNKYRAAVNLDQDDDFSTENLIETIRPFLVFYKKLNKYAKQTKKLNNHTTLKFRTVLANAKDPEKTFFEDLPRAMGFKDTSLTNNEEVLKRYVELLQTAIRDLRSCYIGLIDRLEGAIIDALNLKSSAFSEYKIELEKQYSSIKMHLLTTKQKTFLNRVLAPANDRTTWYQSIAYVILDKQLDNLLDEEEEYLTDNLIYSFNELSKYIDISKYQVGEDENFFRFEMISKEGELKPQIIRLNSKKEDKAKQLEEKINNILSGEVDIDIYTLLSILKNKMKHE